MAGKLVKTAAALLSVMLLFVLAPISVIGADSVAAPVYTIADFESEYGGWKKGENASDVELVDFYEDPEDEDTMRSCLQVFCYEVDVNTIRGAKGDFSKLHDLTEYRKLSYDIFVPLYEADPDALYFTRLTLTSSDGDTFENFADLTPAKWCTVSADIGDWAGRNEIVSAEISLVIGSSAEALADNHFYIDEICALDPIDHELTARYLFDKYSLNGGNARLSNDKTMLTLIPTENAPLTLEASVSLPEYSNDVNCLRLNLANYTDNDTLVINYSTFDTPALSEDKSVTVKLDKQSDSNYYYAFVGDASKLRRIELRFGAGAGRIELRSISAVSAYQEESYTTCGSMNGCRLGDDLATVTFNGDILREEALFNQNGSINVYWLDSNIIPTEAELAELEPILTSPMTTRFELSYRLPQKSVSELQRWYLAVSLRQDGSFALIAPPFQVENPERAATKSISFANDAKGFAPTDLSLAGDAGTGITVLGLDMREAFTEKSEGERYVYDGEAYYFNKSCFDKLSAQINALSDAGTAVLLRLPELSMEYAAELEQDYLSDDYIDYSNTGDEPDGTDYIGALSAYASNLWVGSGKVVGMILGEFSNIITDGIDSLDDAVKHTASELRSVYNNVIARNSSAKVYISVSDLYIREPAVNNGEFELYHFLPALLAETGKNGQFEWDICIDSVCRLIDEPGAEYVTEYDCKDLIDLLNRSGGSDTKLLFCDAKHQYFDVKFSESISWFVRGYYAALSNDRIDAYIAITSSKTDNICEMIKELDTTDGSSVSQLALLSLGIDKWSDVIENFDKDQLVENKVTLYPASTEPPSGIKGSYSYYAFDAFAGAVDLVPSFHCSDLRVTDENILTAELGAVTNGAWMGIAHRFEYPENLNLTPVLEITLKVEEPYTSSVTDVPIKLVLLGEGERFESEADIPLGEWTTLYVYTGNFGEIHNTECLQLLVGGSDLRRATLSVREINGLSREYNDESLESVIADARYKKRTHGTSNPYSATLWVGGAILIGVATVITVALLSRRKERDDDE